MRCLPVTDGCMKGVRSSALLLCVLRDDPSICTAASTQFCAGAEFPSFPLLWKVAGMFHGVVGCGGALQWAGVVGTGGEQGWGVWRAYGFCGSNASTEWAQGWVTADAGQAPRSVSQALQWGYHRSRNAVKLFVVVVFLIKKQQNSRDCINSGPES